jgi:hypothetical protein
MEELIMEFRAPTGIRFNWTALADILAGPTFAHVRKIRIESFALAGSERLTYLESETWRKTERLIRAGALSMLDRRGILHFTLFSHKGGSRYVARSPNGHHIFMVDLAEWYLTLVIPAWLGESEL